VLEKDLGKTYCKITNLVFQQKVIVTVMATLKCIFFKWLEMMTYFQAVKKIGFPGLFTRSLPIRITLVGPVITMQWFFYDSIKLLTGL
jgi:hypothetical protein